MEEFILDFKNLIIKKTNYLSSIKKISNDYYINYFNDIEHGFFHGFCCCYISYIINNKKLDVQLIYSLLLHDFLKCNGYSQEMHDKKLINYYPKLLPETYTHSNPSEENNILIYCDRLELRRYKDYKDWIDNRYYKIYDNFDLEEKTEINYFYNNIRPLLEKIYASENYTNICKKYNKNLILSNTTISQFLVIIKILKKKLISSEMIEK